MYDIVLCIAALLVIVVVLFIFLWIQNEEIKDLQTDLQIIKERLNIK